MVFDPDKFLAETTPTQRGPAQKDASFFDPDKFLADTAPKEERKTEAFIQGLGNSASYGYLPQIQAAVEPAIQGVADLFSDDTDQKLKEQGFDIQNAPAQTYTQRRDQYIKEGQQLADENPYSSMAGNIGGTIATGIATGGGLSKLLGNTARAATFGGRAAQAARAGAVVGAIRNPGDTEGEISPLQPLERIKNAGTDALTGMVFQGGIEGLGKAGGVIKDAGKNLKTYSELKALKASGARLKDFRKAFGKGKASALGKEVIDEGIVGIGDDIGDIAQKAKKAASESNARLDDVYTQADEVLSQSAGPVNFQVNLKNVADKLRGTLKTKYANSLDGDEVIASVEKELEKISSKRDITFGELRKLRQSIDEKINHSKLKQDLPAYQEELSNLRNLIQDEVKTKLGNVSPELKKTFIRENKKLSNLIEISNMAKDKVSRETSNASFGMRERLAGGAGAIVGGGVGGAIGGPVGMAVGGMVGANINAINTKIARQYGTPFVAITANKIARALESNPNLLGKFADPLIKAAQVSPEKFVSSINLLMSDPEFKTQTEDFQDFDSPSLPKLGNSERVTSTKFTRKNP